MDEPNEAKRKRRKRKKSTSVDAVELNPTTSIRTGTQLQNPAKRRKQSDNSIPWNPKATSGKPSHPFKVDDTDHCETPIGAYQDIIALIDQIAINLGKTRQAVLIYDPYYCDGGVRMKLASLGCKNVINENQDFYANIANNKIPDYDLLITNPPYSGEHMEKLLNFAAGSQKPYLLLLPHFVYSKEYYRRSNIQQGIFYLVPKSRYSYLPPQWVAANSGSAALAKGKTQTAPFPSFWYCYTGEQVPHAWLESIFGKSGIYDRNRKLQYASSTAHIPRESKGEFDLSKKRPNPKARKRAMAAKQRGQMAT